MKSPLSGVLTCLFLEFIECVYFKNIVSPNTYFRYIENCILIYLQNTILTDPVNQLNKVEPKIEFIFEPETDYILPFLNIML